MIKSNRRFGVEIEFIAPTEQAYISIANRINVVHDGSLRPLRHAGEFVSPPLCGYDGEMSLRNACDVLKLYGAKSDDVKTSVHVHLDGRNDGGTLRSSSKIPDNVGRCIAISNKLKKELGNGNISKIVLGKSFEIQDPPMWYSMGFDNITYYSKSVLRTKPKINYTYYWLEKPDRFLWLRNVFYFYTKFSNTMEDMVSNSRKRGNMYCIPLGLSYELDAIAKCTNMDELRNVWYKNRPPMGHFDDSRYHNVNLHSFFDRPGTVEIRSHGGSIDATKILLWVRLHQTIVDKLEDVSLSEIEKLGDGLDSFVEFIDSELLEEYVKRLVGYFSGSNKKKQCVD